MGRAFEDMRIRLADPGLLRKRCYRDARWVAADSGRTVPATDPATGEVLGPVPALGVAKTLRPIACKGRDGGHICGCPNRIAGQEGVVDRCARICATAVVRRTVGPGTEPGALVGPLVDDAAVVELEEHGNEPTRKGATVPIGGRRHALEGRCFEPAVLANYDGSIRISHGATFGRAAPLFGFRREDEVIRLAKASGLGLAGNFPPLDRGRRLHVVEALEVALAGANDGVIAAELAPLDGVEGSGTGREGACCRVAGDPERNDVSLAGNA